MSLENPNSVVPPVPSANEMNSGDACSDTSSLSGTGGLSGAVSGRTDPRGTAETRRTPNIILREAKGQRSALAAELAAATGISLIAARILVSRGLDDPEKVRCYLTPNLRHQLPNPCDIKNMIQAAELVLDAIDAGEQITVYTDFDVDGVSAGAQLFLYLRALGAKVNTYTPSRFAEGYGLVCAAVEKLAKLGTQLLITVDCGISCHQEFILAKQLGMRSIVVDHHIPGELPPADVVVDPAQEGCPFQEHKLAAAGLVWMMLIVLRQKARERRGDEAAKSLPDPKDFLDLAALGTICDMVPLMGLNRVIAHRGVEAMRMSTRPGLVALRQIAGVDANPRFGSGQVAFALGPRINAAGRLAEASDVIQMLTTEDSIRARSIASSIDRLNDERRRVEESVRVSCVQKLELDPTLLARPAFAVFGEDYHIGVIGIVAQRLVEQFFRPAAVMAPGEMLSSDGTRQRVIKGSVRSVPGFHVAEALRSISELLITHGGHSEAGGFSLRFENLEKFQAAFVSRAEELLGRDPRAKSITADLEISLADIDFDLVHELMRFQPFGVGNPSPVLITHGVDIRSVTSMAEKHIRVRFSQGESSVGAVGWGMLGNPLIRKGQRVSIAYQPEINTYQGVSSVQLNLRDVW
ncbi:MAG: single-stranded-DNA-specific exonuclease RecJ [Bdellovibrionota bacterium]